MSAALLALSYPPLHPFVLPFVGLAPFALWVADLPPGQDGRDAARRGGVVFGTLYFGAVFYWILVALVWFTKLAVVAFAATLGVLVIMTTGFVWLLHHGIHTTRLPLWVVLPVSWTALEWVRAHLPSTLALPWLGLGTSLTGFPEAVGMAEVIGARGITFWIVLVNALVAGVLVRMREGKGWLRQMAVIGLVLGAPVSWGVWRASTLEMRDAATVAVVQPNIPEHIKLDTQVGLDSTLASLDRLMSRVGTGTVDLVALPEVTLSLFARAPSSASPVGRLQAHSREAGAPLLFGALGYSSDAEDDEAPSESAAIGPEVTPYNSAFLMEPEGLADFEYDKRHLVPVVERVPFVPARMFGELQYFGAYGIGQGWPLAEVDDVRVGVLICYESSYPSASRALRNAGADIVVNITNDAWYGREPLYARTTALWQHPAHLVMRAIENRVGVARSANTGISLFIDPVGRVYSATSLFEEDVRIDVVRTTDVVTFYTRYGDLVGTGAALAALCLALAVLGPLRSRASRTAD